MRVEVCSNVFQGGFRRGGIITQDLEISSRISFFPSKLRFQKISSKSRATANLSIFRLCSRKRQNELSTCLESNIPILTFVQFKIDPNDMTRLFLQVQGSSIQHWKLMAVGKFQAKIKFKVKQHLKEQSYCRIETVSRSQFYDLGQSSLSLGCIIPLFFNKFAVLSTDYLSIIQKSHLRSF